MVVDDVYFFLLFSWEKCDLPLLFLLCCSCSALKRCLFCLLSVIYLLSFAIFIYKMHLFRYSFSFYAAFLKVYFFPFSSSELLLLSAFFVRFGTCQTISCFASNQGPHTKKLLSSYPKINKNQTYEQQTKEIDAMKKQRATNKNEIAFNFPRFEAHLTKNKYLDFKISVDFSLRSFTSFRSFAVDFQLIFFVGFSAVFFSSLFPVQLHFLKRSHWIDSLT